MVSGTIVDRARRGNSLGAEQSLVCRYDLYPAAKLKHSSKSRNTSNAPIRAEADKESVNESQSSESRDSEVAPLSALHEWHLVLLSVLIGR